MINLDEYSDIGTHWVALYVKNNDITYFDSFRVEHIPKEIIKFIGLPSSSALLHKNVIAMLILCSKEKLKQNSRIFFLLMILRKMMI